MARRLSPGGIGIILLLVALLPALFYSAYELNALSTTENLVGAVYRQQLDVVLFSINQYAWDVALGWSLSINGLVTREAPAAHLDSAASAFLGRAPAIRAIVFADTSGSAVTLVKSPDAAVTVSSLAGILRDQSTTISRLSRFSRLDYRKLQPVVVPAGAGGQDLLLLLFITSSTASELKVAGMVIDSREFVDGVVEPKMNEIAGEDFVLTVFGNGNTVVTSTSSPTSPRDVKQEKDLWLLPGFRLGIGLRGTTIESVVRARSYRNLILIGILDVILLLAVWLVYRTIRRELDLVRLKSDFVSNVSHELRTPLALIRMFAETLSMQRVPTEEKKQEYYTTILQETERLTRLVNNILNFSRMEAGRKQYHFAPAPINDIVSGVMQTYASHLEHQGFTSTASLAPGLPDIRADREAIAEALINVVDNAMKYSADEKFVGVATGQRDGMVYVAVEDHGVGIPHEHQEKIFETFYRVTTGLVHTTKGSGLGLSLVKHIVEAHGGRIDLTSAPDRGSTFTLLFPVSTQRGEQPES